MYISTSSIKDQIKHVMAEARKKRKDVIRTYLHQDLLKAAKDGQQMLVKDTLNDIEKEVLTEDGFTFKFIRTEISDNCRWEIQLDDEK